MLKKLLFALNDTVWAYDVTEGKFVFSSLNMETVLGINLHELTPESGFLHQHILPEDLEGITAKIKNLNLDEWAELHYRVKAGANIKWFFEKRTRFIDENNHEIILAVLKDVSDQNTVKYHLDESLGNFSVLFEKSTTPMWIYEMPSLRIIKVNQAAIDRYGYTQNEFLSMTIRDVRPKIDLAAFNEYIFRKGITKGTMQGYNAGGIWQHQSKSGDIIFAEITGYELKYNNSSCRVIIATDVTERVLFEQEKARGATPDELDL